MSVESAPAIPESVSFAPSIGPDISVANEANFSFNPSFSGEIHPIQVSFEPKLPELNLPEYRPNFENFGLDHTVQDPEIAFDENIFAPTRPIAETFSTKIATETPTQIYPFDFQNINVQTDVAKTLELKKDEELMTYVVQKMETYGFSPSEEALWKTKLERAKLNLPTETEEDVNDAEITVQKNEEFTEIEVLKPNSTVINIQTESQTEDEELPIEEPEPEVRLQQIEETEEILPVPEPIVIEIPRLPEEPNWDIYNIRETKVVDTNNTPVKTELDVKFVGRKKHSELEYPAQKLAEDGAKHLIYKNGRWEATKSPVRLNPIEADKVDAA